MKRRFGLACTVSIMVACADAAMNESSSSELRTCRGEPRYDAFLPTGECASVSSSTGTWTARRLFPDAPEPIARLACAYRWVSSAGASPDIGALEALQPRHLAENTSASCDEPAPTRRATDPDGGDGGDSSPTGVSGCDVCAHVNDARVYVILPAERPTLHVVLVPTQDGGVAAFDINPSSDDVRSFIVELPPAPDGRAYVDGPAQIF